MRYAIISGGVVTNVAEAASADDIALHDGEAIAPSQTAGSGWQYDGETFTPPPASKTIDALRASLRTEAETRLGALPYDNHTFDVSDGKEDLVHKWFSGSQAYGDLWAGGTWIHSNAPYEINTAADCATWAMTLFALAAQVHNVRDAHELAIRALTTQAEIDAYDVTANWT